jgi:threonine synthase
LETVVLIPAGQIAAGKLSQAVAYGARVIQISGNFDAALDIAREVSANYNISLVNSVNPHRIEGQKTAAFEIIESLGAAPDDLFIPVGNAGNITAYWKGFQEAYTDERASSLPKMMGFQAEGAAPIVAGHPITNPQTIASAIRIGNPASWSSAIEAREQSGGLIGTVSDDEILEAYTLLARKEGIFGEPASAASVAGAIKSVRAGMDLSSSTVVCIITGHGLKDPSVAMGIAGRSQEEAPANAKIVAGMLGAKATG